MQGRLAVRRAQQKGKQSLPEINWWTGRARLANTAKDKAKKDTRGN